MHFAFGIVVRPPHASNVPVICVSPSGDNEFGRRWVVLNDGPAPESKDLRSPGRRILQDADDGQQNGSHEFPATHGLKFTSSLSARATETSDDRRYPRHLRLENISKTARPIEKMPDDAESIGDNDRW